MQRQLDRQRDGAQSRTTRRKVDSLIERGLLVRLDNGTITFAPGVIQARSTQDLVRRQLEDVIRTANDLVRDGVFEFVDTDPPVNQDGS